MKWIRFKGVENGKERQERVYSLGNFSFQAKKRIATPD